jgi:hypothetical protein
MLRFNDSEYSKLKLICESYDLDPSKRGTISPLLRRLVLNQKADEKDKLPNTSNLAYQINRIGNNINQLVKLAHHKNFRNPNSLLDVEIRKTNELLNTLIGIVFEKEPQ